MSWLDWVSLAVVGVTFACFAYTARFYFARGLRVPRLKSCFVASVCVCAVVLFAVLVSAREVPSAFRAVGLGAFGLSHVIFWWSIFTHGKRPPREALIEGVPESLVTTGPYRYLRHPLYTSYIIAWTAGSIISASPWLLFPALWMLALYYLIAIREEKTLLNSEIGDRYASYRKRTGMFWPRLIRTD